MPHDDYKLQAQMQNFLLEQRKSVLWDASCRLILTPGHTDESAIHAAEMRLYEIKEAQRQAIEMSGDDESFEAYLTPLPYNPQDAINHPNVHGAFRRLCHNEGIESRNWSHN